MRPTSQLKLLIVAALVVAAAVIIPLRRAKWVFASRSQTPAVTSGPRPSLRRRPNEGRTTIRRDAQVQLEAMRASAHADQANGRCPQRLASAVERTVESALSAGAEWTPDPVSSDLRPRKFVQFVCGESRTVPTQVPADLAAPPPRRA